MPKSNRLSLKHYFMTANKNLFKANTPLAPVSFLAFNVVKNVHVFFWIFFFCHKLTQFIILFSIYLFWLHIELPKSPVCKPRRKPKCNKTKFGCCPDNKTTALGPFDEGMSSMFLLLSIYRLDTLDLKI